MAPEIPGLSKKDQANLVKYCRELRRRIRSEKKSQVYVQLDLACEALANLVKRGGLRQNRADLKVLREIRDRY